MTSKSNFQQGSQISLQEMCKEPIPEDYHRYCKQLAFSLITAVTLLAVEIILFKTVGVSQKMIIGFSVAQGTLAVIAIASACFIRQMDQKQSSRRATTTETDILTQGLISQGENASSGPNKDGLYDNILNLDEEGLKAEVLRLQSEFNKEGTLNRKLTVNKEAIADSIKANQFWSRVKPAITSEFAEFIESFGIASVASLFDPPDFVKVVLANQDYEKLKKLENKQHFIKVIQILERKSLGDQFTIIAQNIRDNPLWKDVKSEIEKEFARDIDLVHT